MFFKKKKEKEFEVEIIEEMSEICEEADEICISESDDEPAEDIELTPEVYELKKSTFLSHDGITDVAYYVFSPKNAVPKAVIQLSHGMCEYIERYEKEGFVSRLAEVGIVVCGNDHLGHGPSVSDEKLGFFTETEVVNGYVCIGVVGRCVLVREFVSVF